MDEIRIRKKTVVIFAIVLGLLLIVVSAIRPRTLYEMRAAAISEFHLVMAENDVDVDLLIGPTLNLKYPDFIAFEWYSKDYATDSVMVYAAVKSSWLGGQEVGGTKTDTWVAKYVGSRHRKKVDSR